MGEEIIDVEADWEWMVAHKYAAITDGTGFPQLKTLSKVVKAIVVNDDEIVVTAKDSDVKGTARFNRHFVDVLKAKFPEVKWNLSAVTQPNNLRLLAAEYNDNTYIVLAAKIEHKYRKMVKLPIMEE